MNIVDIGLILMLVPPIIVGLYAIFKFFQMAFEDEDYKSPIFWIGLVLLIAFCIGFTITVMQYEVSK